MTQDKRLAVLALRLIASVAEKAADDLENGRLWPGQLREHLSLISMNLKDAERGDK